MSVSFGVHVGRTSMCLAVEKDGRCDVVANDAGDRVTPAIVGWIENEVLVGLAAKQLSSRKPDAIATASKNRIAENDLSNYQIQIEGTTKNPSVKEVHAKIYKYMQDTAVSHASAEVSEKNTVITVPLEFNATQRSLVTDCATKAGFNVAQVISEPAAACLAYGLGQIEPTISNKCLVFQCGAMSLTVSIVLVTGGMITVQHSITKKVGGDEVTDIVVEQLAQEFKRKYKEDPRESKKSKQKLRLNAENVKHVLSTLETANCYIESLFDGIDFNANVSRSRFDNEFSKMLPKFLDPIQEVLDAAGTSASDIEKVVLCGGTAKIPKLQKAIGGMFAKAQLMNTINADEVIAVGAATQASILTEKVDIALNDRGSFTVLATTHDMVFLTEGEEHQVLIPASCPIPVRRSHHLPSGQEVVTVKVFIRAQKQLLAVTELTLKGLKPEGEGKLSISAHIHRDGSVHIALTDKTTNQCDQVTLAPPPAAAAAH